MGKLKLTNWGVKGYSVKRRGKAPRMTIRSRHGLDGAGRGGVDGAPKGGLDGAGKHGLDGKRIKLPKFKLARINA